MSTYVCPICGKTYDDVNELSNCVAKCAKEKTAEKAAASEQLNKLRMEAYEKNKMDLNIQKEKVNKAYNMLLAEIEKYNNIANKISKIDATFSSKCEASLNFGSSTNKVNVNKTSKPKRMDRACPPPIFPCMPLSALIDELFDF